MGGCVRVTPTQQNEASTDLRLVADRDGLKTETPPCRPSPSDEWAQNTHCRTSVPWNQALRRQGSPTCQKAARKSPRQTVLRHAMNNTSSTTEVLPMFVTNEVDRKRETETESAESSAESAAARKPKPKARKASSKALESEPQTQRVQHKLKQNYCGFHTESGQPWPTPTVSLHVGRHRKVSTQR